MTATPSESLSRGARALRCLLISHQVLRQGFLRAGAARQRPSTPSARLGFTRPHGPQLASTQGPTAPAAPSHSGRPPCGPREVGVRAPRGHGHGGGGFCRESYSRRRLAASACRPREGEASSLSPRPADPSAGSRTLWREEGAPSVHLWVRITPGPRGRRQLLLWSVSGQLANGQEGRSDTRLPAFASSSGFKSPLVHSQGEPGLGS